MGEPAANGRSRVGYGGYCAVEATGPNRTIPLYSKLYNRAYNMRLGHRV